MTSTSIEAGTPRGDGDYGRAGIPTGHDERPARNWVHNREKTAAGFDTIDFAIAEIAAGRAVVVVDDEDRENEGDLIFAAGLATPELVFHRAVFVRGDLRFAGRC